MLVPIDFSLCSTALAAHAGSLAKQLGARVVLLTVVEAPPGLPASAPVKLADGAPVPAGEAMASQAEARMERYRRIVTEYGVDATVDVRGGSVVPTILAAIEETEADMVVMGTHGRRGFAKLMMGSVAQEVVRDSAAPVLTFRGRHHALCDAASCNWCESGMVEVGAELQAELDG